MHRGAEDSGARTFATIFLELVRIIALESIRTDVLSARQDGLDAFRTDCISVIQSQNQSDLDIKKDVPRQTSSQPSKRYLTMLSFDKSSLG